MSLVINTNVASLNAQRNLTGSRLAQMSSLSKLSSGERINKSADDAAGLAISENLKAQVRGLRQAKRNAADGISLVQTAEGGLNEVGSMLIRLREVAIQAASDTIGDAERGFLNIEYQQLKQEIDRVASSTTFNGTYLLNGQGGDFEVQVGIHNNPTEDRIGFGFGEVDSQTTALGVADLGVDSKIAAQDSISMVDTAIKKVAGMRANFGALQNRLTSTINNLDIFTENLSAANSRIRDADIAHEASELTRANIMQQAGVSMLAQANQVPQLALKLVT